MLVPFPLHKITGGIEMESLKELKQFARENGFCCVGSMNKAIKEYRGKKFLEGCLYDLIFDLGLEALWLDVSIGEQKTIITFTTDELEEAFEDEKDILFAVWDKYYDMMDNLLKGTIFESALITVNIDSLQVYIMLDTVSALNAIRF